MLSLAVLAHSSYSLAMACRQPSAGVGQRQRSTDCIYLFSEPTSSSDSTRQEQCKRALLVAILLCTVLIIVTIASLSVASALLPSSHGTRLACLMRLLGFAKGWKGGK